MADEKSYPFVISDESVNRYGYRVLTAGIDTAQFEKNPIMYYLHDRLQYGESKPRVMVIGRWDNVRKENAKLMADAGAEIAKSHHVGQLLDLLA